MLDLVALVDLGSVPQLEALPISEVDTFPSVQHERPDVQVTVAVGGVDHVLVVLAEQTQRRRLVQAVLKI